MSKSISLIAILSLLALAAYGQAQPSGWSLSGYQVSNGKWTVEVTREMVTVKDNDGKSANAQSVYVKMLSTDSANLAIYHKVDLKHPDMDKRVKSICSFFMEKDGTILLRFRNEEILLPTYRRLLAEERKRN